MKLSGSSKIEVVVVVVKAGSASRTPENGSDVVTEAENGSHIVVEP